jgi:arsenate reductase-like glutaredoxin family protein
MPKRIDWLYARKSCTTCKKAQGFLGQESVTVAETVDATKNRYGEKEALALLAGIDTLIAAKGKKVETFDLKGDRPDDETLLARLMGPTGNLRAPAARVGRTLAVGFSEDAYEQLLG